MGRQRAGWLAAAIALLFAAPLEAEELVIALVPLGQVDPKLLQVVASALEAKVDAKARIDPVRELPAKAFFRPRQRWRAEALLEALDADPPAGAWKVVAVTQAEISTTKGTIPDWRIGGLGNIGGRSSIVSSWIFERHSPTTALLHRRLADLAVHEHGHTLGLDHCETPGCVMRDAKGKILSSVDASTSRFCDRCRGKVAAGVLK